MITSQRRISEQDLYQGINEEVIYQVDVSRWGSAPTNVQVKVYEVTRPGSLLDVTATVTTGTHSVAGDIITLPKIRALQDGKVYRVDLRFTTSSNNLFEPYFILRGER